MAVEQVPFESRGLLEGCLSRIDYADAYRTPVTDAQAADVERLAVHLFSRPPSFAKWMMRLRNALVTPLGLKTVTSSSERFGLFRLYSRTDDELLLGEDDKHLNFRVSIRVDKGAGSPCVTVTTVVQFNNPLGELYFLPVRPVHKALVPALMRHALAAR